jgi:hypothetical protein
VVTTNNHGAALAQMQPKLASVLPRIPRLSKLGIRPRKGLEGNGHPMIVAEVSCFGNSRIPQ